MSDPQDPPDHGVASPVAAVSRRPWRDPLLRARWFVPLVAFAVAIAVTVRAHWHFFYPYITPVSNDEGYISALAMRMIHGHWLPYVDGVSQRGPVLYWLAAFATRVGVPFSWLPMRTLALTVGLGVTALTFFVAAELTTPFAAGIAAMFVTYFLTYELNPWDGIGYNGEILGMLFVLASALCLARAQRPTDGARPAHTPAARARLLVAAGLLTALAGLSKQMTLIHAGPALFWLCLGRAGDTAPRSARMRDVARYLAGVATPYALVVALYAVTGHLREFVYYYQRYGRDIFMAPLNREYMRDKLREQIDKYYLGIAMFTSLAAVALSRTARAMMLDEVRGAERVRRHAPALFVLTQFVCATAGACFTWRFFPHYFVQVFPMAALTAGLVASWLGHDPEHPRDRAAIAGGLVLVTAASVMLAVAGSALARNVNTRRETDRWYQDPRADPIVRYVLERTRPDDKIFVWGFRAETYVSAARLPASRYVYTVYPSGVVPWFQSTRTEEEQRAVPGSRQIMLDDLERERPALIIDAGRSMNGRYMYNYPSLRTYLDRNYCFMRYVDGEPVYRRRVHGDCPPADY